jgi:sulfate adenylyltransferase
MINNATMIETSELITPAMKQTQELITPYGSRLVNLLVTGKEREELIRQAASLESVQLSHRSLCDLELLAVGAFSPLQGFMGQADYTSVIEQMRLADGTLFPIPVTLPIAAQDSVRVGQQIALRDARFDLIAIMTVEEVFEWNLEDEARHVYQTTDTRHPLVAEMHGWGGYYIAGPIQVLNLPRHHNFAELRRTPAEVRTLLAETGHANVVAFQTRNPIHRAHEELTKRAAARINGALLLHPVVGQTSPGDVDHYTRVRSYKALVKKYYDGARTVLSLLPLAMRMAGPREAVWHALIRRNYGANYLIVGRDHASPGPNSAGQPFYGTYDAQHLLTKVGPELGMNILPFNEMVYLSEEDRYEEVDHAPKGAATLSLSGSKVRTDYLAKGASLPDWFTRPEVAAVLTQAYPPRHLQGVCIWLTGLSGAGKSTIAEVLTELLAEHGRQATILDGDVVRTNLSKGLGFSKEDRDTNILRIGYVASEIVKHHGLVMCAAVSPYTATRDAVRAMVGAERFVLVYVDTSLELCEQRDTKGLYAKARRGEMKGLTGVDDPYEVPVHAEIVVTTSDSSPQDNAWQIINHLRDKGFLLNDVTGLNP